jgi:hypothetical protein
MNYMLSVEIFQSQRELSNPEASHPFIYAPHTIQVDWDGRVSQSLRVGKIFSHNASHRPASNRERKNNYRHLEKRNEG